MTLTVEKILKKATPTVRTSDNVVKKWDIEVIYKDTTSGWNRAYPHTEDVEYLNLTADQFTKDQLVGFMPSNMDVIFEAHYDAFNTPPKEERISDFNLNNLK